MSEVDYRGTVNCPPSAFASFMNCDIDALVAELCPEADRSQGFLLVPDVIINEGTLIIVDAAHTTFKFEFSFEDNNA